MKGKVVVYKDQEELAERFCEALMERITASRAARFDLAISGGSTPQVLFSALASKYPDSPLWQRVHFWWVDERMVPPDHPESNFGVANRLLFSKINIPGGNIHRIKGENDAYQEAKSYALQIKAAVPVYENPDRSPGIGRPIFDLVILGIGDDGHTASIFPNQMELIDSEDICSVAFHPVSRQARVTLTGKQINQATTVCFLVTGANKADRLAEIFADGEESRRLPASYICPVSGELIWYCDASAVKTL